jgi:hypothetical protein
MKPSVAKSGRSARTATKLAPRCLPANCWSRVGTNRSEILPSRGHPSRLVHDAARPAHGTRLSCLTLPRHTPGLGSGAPRELEPGLDANARSELSGLKNTCHAGAWASGKLDCRTRHHLAGVGTTYLGGWSFLMRSSIPGTTFGPWPLTIFRRPGSNSWKRLSPASLPILEPKLLNVIAAGRAQ